MRESQRPFGLGIAAVHRDASDVGATRSTAVVSECSRQIEIRQVTSAAYLSRAQQRPAAATGDLTPFQEAAVPKWSCPGCGEPWRRVQLLQETDCPRSTRAFNSKRCAGAARTHVG
jgi:hypothetical protein